MTSVSSPPSLKAEAFVCSVESSDKDSRRHDYLKELYGENDFEQKDYDSSYKDHIVKLCKELETISNNKLDVTAENLSKLSSFPRYLFEMIEANPGAIPHLEIIQLLEKIIYAMYSDNIDIKKIMTIFKKNAAINKEIQKQIKESHQKQQACLEMLLPDLLICGSGIMGHLDSCYRYISGGNTVNDILAQLRIGLVEQFAAHHLQKYRNAIDVGNEKHIQVVLMIHAQQKNWGLQSEITAASKDTFAKTAKITPAILNQFETEFLHEYQLRSMTHSIVERFHRLWLNEIKGQNAEEKEPGAWRDYQLQVVRCAEQALALMELKIPAKQLFEMREIESSEEATAQHYQYRFSQLHANQVFWQYCFDNNYLVDRSSWREETSCFLDRNFHLFHQSSLAMTDLAWIQNNEGNLVSYADLPDAEKIRYHIFSVVHYGVCDRFGWTEPRKAFFEIFHEKKDLVELAKALVQEGQLSKHQGLFKLMLIERPQYLAQLLSVMSDKAIDEVLNAIEVDFYYLHSAHELNKQTRKLIFELGGLLQESGREDFIMNRLADRNEKIQQCQKKWNLELEELPISYSKLLEKANGIKSNDSDAQFVFKIYLQHYFPKAYRLHSEDKEPNYAALFKQAHEDFFKSKTEENKSLHRLVRTGILEQWARENEVKKIEELKIMPGKLFVLLHSFHLLQQQHCLNYFFKSLMLLYGKPGEKIPYNAPRLYWAVAFKQKESIGALLDIENINAKCSDGETAFHSAARVGDLDTLRLLLENGANINVASNDGTTALYIAAQQGDLDVVRFLLDNGANINAALNEGATALIIAALRGDLDVVRFLLKNGANINAARNNGATALYFPAELGHLDMVRLLLENGANINATLNEGATALFSAAQRGHLDVVRMLLENGANINAALNEGATALYFAAQQGHLDVVRLLLKQNADPHMEWNQLTPFDVAKNPEIKKILLAAELTLDLDIIVGQLSIKSNPIRGGSDFFKPKDTKELTKEHFPAMKKLIAYLNDSESVTRETFIEIKEELKNTHWAKYCETAESLKKEADEEIIDADSLLTSHRKPETK